jgi:hypothetical protein
MHLHLFHAFVFFEYYLYQNKQIHLNLNQIINGFTKPCLLFLQEPRHWLINSWLFTEY